MIEMGVIVAIGLLVTLAKCTWSVRMWILSHPVFMDGLIFTVLLLIHWGTFSGVMVATIGALTCSLVISGASKLYGSVQDGKYIPGYFDVSSKLKAA